MYSLEECYSCHNKCKEPLKSTSEFQQVLLGQFDAVLNQCLHSCTKQKRKSVYLNPEAAACYTECLAVSEGQIEELKAKILASYDKFDY
mmetsp:Transcript_18723/g.33924  ORF Transcript_18723/g.33924 Transcript_18723/m.33924 type:complete len:89 (-) Transcript_18723:858-1124(-)